jgi:hypothetical protein
MAYNGGSHYDLLVKIDAIGPAAPVAGIEVPVRQSQFAVVRAAGAATGAAPDKAGARRQPRRSGLLGGQR